MSVDTYRTVAGTSSAEFKDKGSRFIAFAYPIRRADEVKALLEPLRQSHHKARHWCYAYRVGTDGLQFRANDDGEPAGSAAGRFWGRLIRRRLLMCWWWWCAISVARFWVCRA